MPGQDLVHSVEITAIDAMLGVSVKEIPSHEGEREIELPSGTQHGTQYAPSRERAAGLERRAAGRPGRRRPRGRPRELSEDQAELARKLGETLEARNLRAGGAEDEGFFCRVRRAFG